MTVEIIKALTEIKDTSDITSNELLIWVIRIEAQRALKVMYEFLKENTCFDAFSRNKLKPIQEQYTHKEKKTPKVITQKM